MLQYLIAGLVLGGIYAVAASGLVITYRSAGILNFAFGAIAFTIARFYYFLNTQHSWAILPAALLSILVAGPALGLLLYFGLFRLMGQSSTLIKVLVTIGVSVALIPTDTVVFGSQTIIVAPGLAPQPERVFNFLGVPVTLDQLIVYACVIVLLVAGFCILRYTDVGLQVRALVDSPAMTSLSGTNPRTMSMAVWAVSTGIAGLTGVLVAPIVGLDSGNMTILMVTAFSAVIAARLRSLPIAAAVGLGMGIAESLVQYFLPPASSLVADVLPSIPFIVAAIFLLYFTLRRGSVDEAEGVGGALDRAIRPQGTDSGHLMNLAGATSMSWRPSGFAFLCLCGLPFLLHSFWIGLLAQGIAYGVIFLSFSLVTGEGGMIWLCQATFAGIGGMTAALLTADQGVPILLSVLIGGLIAAPIGAIVGFLTIRMGNLYVALVTLSFGLLVENVVFTRQIFTNNMVGTNVNPPQFAEGARALTFLCIAVFAVVAILVVNVRRSTTGLALGAVRHSPAASRTIGISVLKTKILVAGLAAFVAGIGGGLLAITLGSALPSNYSTLGGEIWLAVLVTQGIRSNAAALFAGLGQTILAGVALAYLPKVFGNFVAILFGLGAIAMVKFPEGVLTMQARQARSTLAQLRDRNPQVFRRLQIGASGYFVVFVTLIVAVRNLWWLWLAVTFVIQNIVAGILIARSVRKPKVLIEPRSELIELRELELVEGDR